MTKTSPKAMVRHDAFIMRKLPVSSDMVNIFEPLLCYGYVMTVCFLVHTLFGGAFFLLTAMETIFTAKPLFSDGLS